MNRQEALNIAARGILEQGAYSLNKARTSCMYRGENGTKCAVGHLIPDDDYDPLMEGKAASDYKILDVIDVLCDNFFLCSMQARIHDIPSIEGWDEAKFRERVNEFASAQGLKNPLDA